MTPLLSSLARRGKAIVDAIGDTSSSCLLHSMAPSMGRQLGAPSMGRRPLPHSMGPSMAIGPSATQHRYTAWPHSMATQHGR